MMITIILRSICNFLYTLQSALQTYERSKIAEALEEVSFPDAHSIVREGDDGDTFFIVRKGRVNVTKRNSDGVDENVALLSQGDYFGERALMQNEARAATITAEGEVECLCLNREAFALLLGPLADILKKRVETYNEPSSAAASPSSSSKSSDKKEKKSGGSGGGGAEEKSDKGSGKGEKKKKGGKSKSKKKAEDDDDDVTYLDLDVPLKDLECLGTLGKGSFGHVTLVKVKGSKSKAPVTYALKAVSKQQIVQSGQQEHIMSEKSVMARLNHPFLIRLYQTYQVGPITRYILVCF
jgi:hypothetical protein